MKAYKGGKSSDSDGGADPNFLRAIQKLEKAEGRKIIIPNESEAKYSAMLLDLIKPYHADLPDSDEVEALLELATVAWNLACMKKLLPKAYKLMWQETKDSFEGDKTSIRLLEKMVKEKSKKYAAFDMFIHNAATRTAPDGELIVTVTAQPLEGFLEDTFLGEDDDENDDEMNLRPGFINRNAFTVIPRQPFVTWRQSVEESLFPLEEIENNIYLIEEKENNAEIEAWLKKNFDNVFKKELEAGYTDEKRWPKNRSYKMFREWFDLSFQSTVYDLEDYPVDKDME